MIGLLFAAVIPLLPDPVLTPGANNPIVLSHVPLTTLCTSGYTARPGVRNVTDSTKSAIFAVYHINPKIGGPYEIDHLCSLELGCTNDPKNLWPQSYTTKPWNAHLKDVLENKLHALVCAKTNPLSLAVAQHDISTNWITAYQKYVNGH